MDENNVDTEQKVSLERLEHMSAEQHVEGVLESLTVRKPGSLEDLQACIQQLDAELAARTDCRLVVIDSIAAPVRRSDLPTAHSAALLMHVAQNLKRLAHEWNLAVILINQVGGTEGAALGTSWHHCVTTRIQLELLDDGKRKATVVKSNEMQRGTTKEFRITNRGIEMGEE